MLLDSVSATEDVHYIGAYNSESAINLEQLLKNLPAIAMANNYRKEFRDDASEY